MVDQLGQLKIGQDGKGIVVKSFVVPQRSLQCYGIDKAKLADPDQMHKIYSNCYNKIIACRCQHLAAAAFKKFYVQKRGLFLG